MELILTSPPEVPVSYDDSLFNEIIHGVKRASVRKVRSNPTPYVPPNSTFYPVLPSTFPASIQELLQNPFYLTSPALNTFPKLANLIPTEDEFRSAFGEAPYPKEASPRGGHRVETNPTKAPPVLAP